MDLAKPFPMVLSWVCLEPMAWVNLRKRGCCRDQVGVVIVIAALVAAFLVVLVLFSGAFLVAVLCLEKGWILAWSFRFLFCRFGIGWRFRCSLGCCFGFCFCVVGGPGTRIGSCMVVSVALSYDFGCYCCIYIDDCQTILTFQHVILSVR